MSRRLLLVRHGITDWNREGRFQGHRDPPLSAQGLREAGLVRERLWADGERPARIVSSPLVRSLQTAQIIADGGPVETDARLIEIGQGEWEGRTHRELRETDAERYAAWRAQAGEAVPPGGEALSSALERAAQSVDDAVAVDRWPLCLVAHGGILRLMARHLLALDHQRAWGLDLANASLSILEQATDGWRLERWNDVGHLLAPEAQGIGPEPEESADRSDEGEPLAL